MMQQHPEVLINNLEIKDVDDLYLNVLVPDGEDDYTGRTIYQVVTVWYCVNNIAEFEMYMNVLGVEGFMNFRDQMDANILSSVAQSNKPIEFWELIENFIGEDNFIKLLTMSDRSGRYPITEISNVDVFAKMINKTLLTPKMIRQICTYGNDGIVEYITTIVNLFNPNEFN